MGSPFVGVNVIAEGVHTWVISIVILNGDFGKDIVFTAITKDDVRKDW